MRMKIERVEKTSQFSELLVVFLEYERSLDVDLRHGAEPTLSEVTERFQAPNVAFLAYVDDTVAGCVVAHALDKETTVMQRLFARPSYRKHGLGRALTQELLSYAREHGFRRVVLDTEPVRLEAAYRLYLSLGFTPCEPFAQVTYANPAYLERILA